ncbi:MAG: selenium-dependent molybdenum cofactor biosynthesis protein YqeB [Anaerolineales bacterium]
MTHSPPLVLLRGGGDLATGVAARLWRSGFWVVVAEIAHPLAVRRLVSLAEAVYAGEVAIEDLRGKLTDDPQNAREILQQGSIPVFVDRSVESRHALEPSAIVDARMTKFVPSLALNSAPMMIGLGPGFEAGTDVHAVVETNRGHYMGRVYWEGSAQPDTGVPDRVDGRDVDRVLRAPVSGLFKPVAEIGTLVNLGEMLAEIDGTALVAPFDGALRGLLHAGIKIEAGVKVGDLDPRQDLSLCTLISDKSLAVGGGVLEALLSRRKIRAQLAGSMS